MRIVFMGTPDFAVPTLTEIVARGHDVMAVYTRAPAPAGRRGLDLTPSPVHRIAEGFGIPVRTPRTLRSEEERAAFRDLAPEVAVVVAYGMILPQAILDVPEQGCLNLHGSLLPRWRGAAPIQRAIEAGDRETGVTVMQMEAGLDTGPMLLKVSTPISATDTGGSLHDRLAELGPPAVLNAIEGLAAGTLHGEVQDDALATYAHKLNKQVSAIDWQRPASELDCLIRAFNPWPLAHAQLDGKPLKVWAAELADGQGTPGQVLACEKRGLLVACGEGALRLTRLQLPGGKPLAFADLYNARRDQFAPGLVLGNGQ